jgi:hypothetical protein
MAGILNIRLPDGRVIGIGLADAALDKLGVGPEATFDGENFLASRAGLSFDSPLTDIPGRIEYQPSAIGEITWARVYDAFVADVNIDRRVSAVGGDFLLALMTRWQHLETAYVAKNREGRPPEKLRPWSDRDELLAAIAVRTWDGTELVSAIRAVQSSDPQRFAAAFRGKSADSQVEAARRAYYREFDES